MKMKSEVPSVHRIQTRGFPNDSPSKPQDRQPSESRPSMLKSAPIFAPTKHTTHTHYCSTGLAREIPAIIELRFGSGKHEHEPEFDVLPPQTYRLHTLRNPTIRPLYPCIAVVSTDRQLHKFKPQPRLNFRSLIVFYFGTIYVPGDERGGFV